MKLTELLAIYTNAESTDEQKQAALAAYEEANKPAEPDSSELEALKESIAKLEAKNSELLQEKKTAKQQAEEAARASMTTEELKADYEMRMEKLKGEIEGEWSGKYNKVLEQLQTDRIDGKALKLASKLSDYPDALLPHIKSRIGFEVGDNGFEDFVKGQDGKRTAATWEELEAEFKAAEHLKPLLKSDFSNKGTQETRTEPVDKKSSEYKQGDSLSYLQSVANSVGE
ncbi:coil containing protein [Vibrio phage BUCT006]|nr:coil containing protein [Vibrio phage BUCT006]